MAINNEPFSTAMDSKYAVYLMYKMLVKLDIHCGQGQYQLTVRETNSCPYLNAVNSRYSATLFSAICGVISRKSVSLNIVTSKTYKVELILQKLLIKK
jgi:hypothetical protein